jgi:choline dehydrogenase-like flavoprotein
MRREHRRLRAPGDRADLICPGLKALEEFDYVIVGAGTAGCVVASRLAADGRHQVLLLEAGGSDRHPYIQLPIGYGRLLFDTRINWMYETEAEPALAGRRGFWPRGKVVGGSGSINALLYVRGLPSDFDDWQALGNPGWGYQDVLSYFLKSEDHGCDAGPYHGRDGPMHVTDVSADAHPLCQLYLQSCEALGFRHTADFNGAAGEGVGIYQINTRRGRRASTANEFLRPALVHSNLVLRQRAQATRVLFEGRRAAGIEFLRGGRRCQVRANRAVVLCGGSINSPQLLQLSGVGSSVLLQSLGIPVVADLPGVGQNLQDHLAVSYFYNSSRPTLNDELNSLAGKFKVALQYLLHRRGTLAMSVNQAGGFVRSDAAQRVPNLQLYFNPVSYTQTPLADRKLLRPDPFSAFLLSFNSCRPTSRGSLSITSADPLVHPRIQPNYLATDQDLADALSGCRLLRQLAATPPLSQVITGELEPGLDVRSDSELLQDFRSRSSTVFHPVSTCMMGPDARSAVVDARLRVHGLGSLWVVDSSVFPTITSGNVNAPTVMVAEKGADMILKDGGAG